MTDPIRPAPSPHAAGPLQPVPWWRHPLRRPPAAPPWLHAEVARRMDERLAVIRREPAVVVDVDGWRSGSAALLQQRYARVRMLQTAPDDMTAQVQREAARQPWWRRALGAGASVPEVCTARELDARARQAPMAGMVWANMALHTRADAAATLRQWLGWLQVDGFLMFSCLGPDSLRELREVHAAHGWGEACPPWIDMHDLGDELVRAGYADPVMDAERLTLTYGDPDRLVADLRALGPNLHPARFAALRTPRWRARWWDALLAGASDARVRLTFEVIHGHAFRAEPRIPVASQTHVELDTMRRMLRGGRSGA